MNASAWIALFGCLGIVIPVLMTGYLTVWSKRNVGKANGHGPLNSAMHRVIVQQAQSDIANDIKFQAVFDHLKIKPPAVPAYELVEQMLHFPNDLEGL